MGWCWICTKFEEAASNSSQVEHISTGAAAKSLGERESETLIHGQRKRARINPGAEYCPGLLPKREFGLIDLST